MNTILVVDDEIEIVNLVSIHLSKNNYRALKATNGVEALDLVERELPDLAIVDVMMPGMNGFELTKQLRQLEIPVLLLTAKGELDDKKTGFLAGADDYVVKPFEPEELIYRVSAILRRYDKSVDEIISVGDMTINQKSYEVTIKNKTLLLPLKEFELLSVLASRPNHVFSRDVLIERVWGLDFMGDDQTINVHVKRLREKLSPITDLVHITTVRGVGYKLEVE
ncbi:MAG TPA: response regulator transcription factor [Pseudogracilibacillus sp.]|nr:response regulator transcription factor [Pseudogracilibacillus sp.]